MFDGSEAVAKSWVITCRGGPNLTWISQQSRDFTSKNILTISLLDQT